MHCFSADLQSTFYLITISLVQLHHLFHNFSIRVFVQQIFDILKTCRGRNNQYRILTETIILGNFIHHVIDIASEGEERFFHFERLWEWRTLFAKFYVSEPELNDSCLYHVKFNGSDFACSSSCTLNMDGDGIINKWKGTPIEVHWCSKPTWDEHKIACSPTSCSAFYLVGTASHITFVSLQSCLIHSCMDQQ